MLTNGTSRRAETTFFHELDIDRRDRQDEISVGTADGALLYTNPDLDVTLVRFQGAPRLDHYLPLRPVMGERNQRVAIIQHPGGFLKKISLQNNLVAHADDRLVEYYTSTQAGSSGSPVFDDGFSVVAIHHSTVSDAAWDDGGSQREAADSLLGLCEKHAVGFDDLFDFGCDRALADMETGPGSLAELAR